MLILVRHAPPFRRWHRRLGERLATAGHSVRYEAAGKPVARRLLALERRLYRLVPDWDAPEPPPAARTWAPDLTIALAGPPPGEGLVVRPAFDGAAGEAPLLAAMRAGVAALVVVRGASNGAMRLLAAGRPAMEDARVLARALEDVLPRLVTLLVQAVARLASRDGEPPALDETSASRYAASAPAFLSRAFRHKLARRLGPARGRPEHWRLALRREGHAAYTLLPDEPSRFCADPFLFAEAGQLWLFYEQYSYGTGRGVIAALAVASITPAAPPGGGLAQSKAKPDDRDLRGPSGRRCPSAGPKHGSIPAPDPLSGRTAESRTVLEEPFHLSYPLVLRHRGAIYMLPETSAASCVRLYRAAPFPHRWIPDAVLLAGRKLADATPVLHENRWWLFATSTDDGGSSWDQLHLFHAPDLLGPWTPHAGNPVLIDAGAARPAGLMWHEDGVLMRPVQDCRTGYGTGVAFCRVDRLDEGGYRQSVVRRIGPPPGLRATGLHTFNREAGWEVVDLKVPHPR